MDVQSLVIVVFVDGVRSWRYTQNGKAFGRVLLTAQFSVTREHEQVGLPDAFPTINDNDND